MKKILKFLLNPFLGRKYLQPFFEFLHLASLKGMNIGSGSDVGDSGELAVLRNLAKQNKPSRPAIIFDAGANIGKYALAVSKTFLAAGKPFAVYSFEPVPQIFSILKTNVGANASVHLTNQGLGDVSGRQKIFYEPKASGLTSLYERDYRGADVSHRQVQEIDITTVDEFCQKNNISHIDLLKLDVEGYELNVLHGAKAMLQKNAIDYIQFEFGGTALDARIYLKDFFACLGEKYEIYRVLQNGLRLLPYYEERHEIFLTTNFLAKRKNLVLN